MYKKDIKAFQNRMEFFKTTPSLNWKALDKKINYHFRNDRLSVAKEMGFQYISECTVKLYFKHMSTHKVGRILGCSGEGIMSELQRCGVPRQKHGGFRPGDSRARGRKSRNLLSNRIKRPEIRNGYNGPFTG